jgi:hypothetical protein
MKLLKESVDRDPPESELDGDRPSDDPFYEGAVPKWSPIDADETTDTQP